MLNKDEIAALRYYIGDVSGDDPFWGDPKAYVVLNSLFFPGIISETARAAEGKRLNPAILSDIPRLLELLAALMSAFGSSTVESPAETFRVERFSDYELCRSRGATVSMTSTSSAGFLNAYRDRRGIALMRFRLTPGTPCINVSETLEFYAKPEEAEILLPPFLRLSIREVPLLPDELTITDCDGAPPVVSCRAEPAVQEVPSLCRNDLSSDGAAAGQRIYAALNDGKSPGTADTELYSQWKCRLMEMFR